MSFRPLRWWIDLEKKSNNSREETSVSIRNINLSIYLLTFKFSLSKTLKFHYWLVNFSLSLNPKNKKRRNSEMERRKVNREARGGGCNGGWGKRENNLESDVSCSITAGVPDHDILDLKLSEPKAPSLIIIISLSDLRFLVSVVFFFFFFFFSLSSCISWCFWFPLKKNAWQMVSGRNSPKTRSEGSCSEFDEVCVSSWTFLSFDWYRLLPRQ